MIVAIRRSLALVMLLVVGGCTATAPSAIPSPSPSSSPAASAAPTTAASNAPSGPAASVAPSSVPATASPASSAAACAGLPQTVALPSDRFTGLEVVPGAGADRLTFAFGNPSLPGPPAPPQGTLMVARPPYTQAASGAPITMAGDHVVQVRFTNMSLANDVGQPTYTGPTDVTPHAVSLQQAVLFDASEGVVGWYVGYDGPGCVTLVADATGVTLVIAHG